MEVFDKIFDEFPSVDKEGWKKKTEADLKGKKNVEELDWIDEDGIRHQAYYHQNDIPKDGEDVGKTESAWQCLQLYHLSDWEPTELNHQLEQAFDNGLQTAVLSGVEFSGEHWDALASGWKEKGMLKYLIRNDFSKENWLGQDGLLVDPIGNMFKKDKVDHDQLNELEDYFKSQLDSFNNQKFLLVEGSIYGKMGATAAGEIAFTLYHYTEYLDHLTNAGQKAEAVARSILINTSIGSAYFLQIAKFRALRKNLERILDHYECNEGVSIWAESNSLYLDDRNFNNNLIRLTNQAMSASLGSCDMVGLQPLGAGLDRKNFAMRMCRNIQLILKHESRFNQVEEMIKGAYYLEDISEKLAEKSWQQFLELESQGSFLEQISSGKLKDDLNSSLEKKMKDLHNADQIMVGVNRYQYDDGLQNESDAVIVDPNFQSLSAMIKKEVNS